MKDEKIVQYLFSSKQKMIAASLKDMQKYDARLLTFLSSDKVDAGMYRRILLNIPTKVIPRMANPLLLADFLTSAYETQSNASKILALHGLYILLTQHNLEYPFFYGKLYSLLTIDLFSAKYKARFFYLLDIFLQSSHLPVNLVASFAKRLARLALWIPQHDQCLILTFIHNLIIRHPTMQVMIDRSQTGSSPSHENAYLPDELDPNKTNAIDSSLWEIETLTHHHHPDVGTCAVALISLRKLTNERDIHHLLEIDYDEMFHHDINRALRSGKRKSQTKTTAECPINYNVAVSLFG